MKIGDIFYWIAIIGFSWITFMIVLRNFQSKFDSKGRRKDLIDNEEKESK